MGTIGSRLFFRFSVCFVPAQWRSSSSGVRWSRLKPLTRSLSTSVTSWASPHYQPRARRCRSETSRCKAHLLNTGDSRMWTEANNADDLNGMTESDIELKQIMHWFTLITGGDAAQWSVHLLWCHHRQFWRLQGNCSRYCNEEHFHVVIIYHVITRWIKMIITVIIKNEYYC